MIVHSVYFWLDRNLSADDLGEFTKGVESLKMIPGLNGVFIGAPAETRRPAVDRTYDVGLTILMENLDVHQAYQEHPLHRQFLDRCSRFWVKVVIYDHEDKTR
jgi:hypothetical protein